MHRGPGSLDTGWGEGGDNGGSILSMEVTYGLADVICAPVCGGNIGEGGRGQMGHRWGRVCLQQSLSQVIGTRRIQLACFYCFITEASTVTEQLNLWGPHSLCHTIQKWMPTNQLRI